MKKSIVIKLMLNILLFIIIFSQVNIVFAAGDQSVSGIVEGGSAFIDTGEKQESPITTGKTDDLTQDLYNILLFAGIVIAVIIGIILGIQFMTGSVEQKAKVKDALVPYIVGCIVIFGAFGIWKLVVTILKGI